MSDNLAVEPTPAESFTLSPDEPSTENILAPEASTFEKIKRAGAKVFEKHGIIFKRTGGRPRKDGLPNKGDIPLNTPASSVPAFAAAPAPLPAQEGLDPALIRRCCSAVIKAVGGIMDKLLHRKATIVGYTPQEAQQLVVDCAITTQEMDSFSELAEVCLRKYGVGTEYAPEIGLGCIVLGVGIRYSVALGTLERERKAKLKAQNIEHLHKQ